MVADNEVIIKVENVSKTFKLPHERHSSFKSAMINLAKQRGYERQHVLKNITFDVKRGEFFGIVGRNGSGKSTLLKLLAGIYETDKGAVSIRGSLTPFIELGVGFNPELTGRENVFLNGALLGFNRKEMEAMYNDIVSFAELQRFMDLKLKNYSSGMQVRLAFSIAIRAKSDILLIDEVLAVGDVSFQEKCFEVFRQIKKEGRTVVFVSHDLASLQEFCDRAVLIDQGEQKGTGDVDKIVLEYQTIMASQDAENRNQKESSKTERPGSGQYRVKSVVLRSADNKKTHTIKERQPFTIEVEYERHQNVDGLVCGISISDMNHTSVIGPNTKEAGFDISKDKLLSGKAIRAVFDQNVLSAGTYKITVGLFDTNGLKPYDFYDGAVIFKVIGKARHGKTSIEPKWTVITTSK